MNKTERLSMQLAPYGQHAMALVQGRVTPSLLSDSFFSQLLHGHLHRWEGLT